MVRLTTSGPLGGEDLIRVFGRVRAEAIGGLPWVSAKDRGGKADNMAVRIVADAAARADVVPTMYLLFQRAKSGSMSRPDEVLRDPSFAFGAWCSQFTALREEHRGVDRPTAVAPPARASPGLGSPTLAGSKNYADGMDRFTGKDATT